MSNVNERILTNRRWAHPALQRFVVRVTATGGWWEVALFVGVAIFVGRQGWDAPALVVSAIFLGVYWGFVYLVTSGHRRAIRQLPPGRTIAFRLSNAEASKLIGAKRMVVRRDHYAFVIESRGGAHLQIGGTRGDLKRLRPQRWRIDLLTTPDGVVVKIEIRSVESGELVAKSTAAEVTWH